jgi:hypothetical protein
MPLLCRDQLCRISLRIERRYIHSTRLKTPRRKNNRTAAAAATPDMTSQSIHWPPFLVQVYRKLWRKKASTVTKTNNFFQAKIKWITEWKFHPVKHRFITTFQSKTVQQVHIPCRCIIFASKWRLWHHFYLYILGNIQIITTAFLLPFFSKHQIGLISLKTQKIVVPVMSRNERLIGR